jgi:soluble lytic murein transglycosylase-like protein
MDRMTLLMIGALALTPPAAYAASPSANAERWQGFIAEASRRFGVPEPWIRAVMQAESGGRVLENGRPITSPKGAMGLMQVMPDTYEEMRRAHHLGADPYDPRDNILAGTAYLRAMFDRYGYPHLFAAYNAGPGRYADSRDGRPLPAETRAYLATVTGAIPQGDTPIPFRPEKPPIVGNAAPLFVILGGHTEGDVSSSGALFFPLTTGASRGLR